MKSTLEVFAPVAKQIFVNGQDEAEMTFNALRELEQLSNKLTYCTCGESDLAIKIDVFSDSKLYQYFDEQWKNKKIPRRDTFIRLESKIEYTRKDLSELLEPTPDHEMSEGNLEYLYCDMACEDLRDRLFDICIASNIAYPGSMSFNKCLLYIDNEYVKEDLGAQQSFYESFQTAKKYKWPPITTLDLNKVIGWLDKIPGFKKRIGKTKLGRAIGAFSYLINKDFNDDELALIWALIGLESLYGSSSTGIKSQILEKSEAYLGSRSEFKKKFSWMYDYRSRLLHGDVDIIFNHNSYDATKEFNDFMRDRFECKKIATSILIATLQKMCANNQYQLNFQYTVE